MNIPGLRMPSLEEEHKAETENVYHYYRAKILGIMTPEQLEKFREVEEEQAKKPIAEKPWKGNSRHELMKNR